MIVWFLDLVASVMVLMLGFVLPGVLVVAGAIFAARRFIWLAVQKKPRPIARAHATVNDAQDPYRSPAPHCDSCGQLMTRPK